MMMDAGFAHHAWRRSGATGGKGRRAWLGAVLLALLAGSGGALMAAGRETWVEVRSPHFIAYSDAGEAQARKTLEGFEAIREVFTLLLPGLQVDLHKPTVILVTADQRSMSRFAPGHFEGKDPKRTAGVFNQGRDRNYVLLRLDVSHQADQPYFVLFHEFTHQVVHQNFPHLPTWLDEGLADFYGTTELHEKKVYLGRVPLGRLATLQRGRMPLKELLTVTQDSPHYQEGSKAGTFYAQSWALTHYLLMDPEAQKAGRFQSYLRALAHASDPLAAAQEGFGDLGKLEGALSVYGSQARFSFWTLPLKVTLSDRDFVARTLNEAEALVLRAEYLLLQRHAKEAQALLEQAQSLAPQNPAVQTGRGLFCERQGRYEEARAAFLSALELGSQDFRSALHLAQLAQAQHMNPPPSPDQVLGWLEVVRSLRPDYPGLHWALCRQYAEDPKAAERAIQEGIEAVKLDPGDLYLRMNFGAVLLRLDRTEAATRIGEQLDQMAQTTAERGRVAAYKAQLDDFLARRSQAATGKGAPGADAALLDQGQPLKFSLPSNWAELGREVQLLVLQGELDQAIQKVERAVSRAGSAYEKKALNALLAQLRGRKAGKPPAP
jgi:tetratricopeptide (TPR) repeat protein